MAQGAVSLNKKGWENVDWIYVLRGRASEHGTEILGSLKCSGNS